MLIGMAVGVAAMALGAGEAGMAAIALGQQAAHPILEFSRAQEATADQRGQKFLRATHQSGNGMLEVFQKFAQEDAMSGALQADSSRTIRRTASASTCCSRLVDASPYKDVKDSPETVHEFP